MYYIDPHIHMISRITDDYERMAQCGCVAVSEPAFWTGFDRGSAEGFRDYFRHLTEIEPKRAAQFQLSREVIALIPEYLNLDLAAILDRIGRGRDAGATDKDPRLEKIRQALEVLHDRSGGRAERIQRIFSLDYDSGWEKPKPK